MSGPTGRTVRITDKGLEHVLLGWLIHPDEQSTINAALYADAILRLLAKGYVRLEGTLSAATLEVTDRGRAAYEEGCR